MTSKENTVAADDERARNVTVELTTEGSARRTFLLGAAGGMATLAAGGLVSGSNEASAQESRGAAVPLLAYVGCFTTERRKAKGKGISVYRIDPAGAWTLLQTAESVPNPQFIAFDRQHKFLYSVHGDGTEVSAYAIDKPSGQLKFLNKQPTNGNNSTHLTPDPSNRYIVIGNGPGVAVFSDQRGRVAQAAHRHDAGAGHQFRSARTRQSERRAGLCTSTHYVSFDPSGRFLVAPDRGTDRVLIYRLDPSTGKLAANDPAFGATRHAAGPRHLAFHPSKPWAYVCDARTRFHRHRIQLEFRARRVQGHSSDTVDPRHLHGQQ